jgi:Raf kinase inhibitor-like YbhB/YbcL family protein
MPSNRFILTSPSFEDGGMLPVVHANFGYGPGAFNTSPQLVWKDQPADTRSLALICTDPDAVGGTFVHWVIYNIPADVHELPAGLPQGVSVTLDHGTCDQGRNDYHKIGYGGPQPPVGTGIHRYRFTLFALDIPSVPSTRSTTAAELQELMEGHIIATAQLVGRLGALTEKK